MSVFVSLLRSYRSFLLLEEESRELFDRTSFLAEMKEDMVVRPLECSPDTHGAPYLLGHPPPPASLTTFAIVGLYAQVCDLANVFLVCARANHIVYTPRRWRHL